LLHAQSSGCPDGNEGGFGPFDFSDAAVRAERYPIVEINHFTIDVENLLHGKTSSIGSDIDYTIRAFPNHYRALDAMSRLAAREHTTRARGARCTPEGYFERAIRFKPNDPMVRMTYGIHFYRNKMFNKALEQLKLAESIDGSNANVQYNLGLIYFDQKKFDLAKASAIKAYAGNFPLEGLRNKLVKAKVWDGVVPAKSDDTAGKGTSAGTAAATSAPQERAPEVAPAATEPPAGK
jgi:tetratricopeptide (TPR) repeat protein